MVKWFRMLGLHGFVRTLCKKVVRCFIHERAVKWTWKKGFSQNFVIY
jgi:hypothetical protein